MKLENHDKGHHHIVVISQKENEKVNCNLN